MKRRSVTTRRVASAVYTSGPGGGSGGGGRGGRGGLRGRLELVQSDMTTVIEDRRQEPADEERLCASVSVFLCIP